MNEPNPYQSPREVVQEVDSTEQPKILWGGLYLRLVCWSPLL